MFTVSKSFIKGLFPYQRNNAPALRQIPKGQSMRVWTQLDLSSQTCGCLRCWRWGLALTATDLQMVAKLPPEEPGSCHDVLCKSSQISDNGIGSGGMEYACCPRSLLGSWPQKKSHYTQEGQGSFPPPTPPGRPKRTQTFSLPQWKSIESKHTLNNTQFKQHPVVSEMRYVLVQVLCQKVSN